MLARSRHNDPAIRTMGVWTLGKNARQICHLVNVRMGCKNIQHAFVGFKAETVTAFGYRRERSKLKTKGRRLEQDT
jgi:hypothetical protein